MEPLEQQLSQIQAITCSNDRERHTQVLQQTNGNVQAALDILFSDPAVPAASPLGPRTVGFRAPRGLRGITRLGMGLGWAVYSIVLWPVGIVWGVLVGGWRFLARFLPRSILSLLPLAFLPGPTPSALPKGLASRRFLLSLEHLTNAQPQPPSSPTPDGDRRADLPEFFIGTYKEAIHKVKEEGRVLLVGLFSSAHEKDSEFKRTVLTDPALITTLKRHNVLFWAGDVHDKEPYQVTRLLPPTTYPSLTFISLLPSRTRASPSAQPPPKLTVLSRLEGPSTTSTDLINTLEQSVLPRVSATLHRIHREIRLREEERSLRETQDRAFREAEERDLERILKVRREREERELEERRREEEKERVEREKVGRERYLRWARRTVVPLQIASEGGVQITLRVPPKQTPFKMTFQPTCPLETLYLWADTLTLPDEDDHDDDEGAPSDEGYTHKWTFRLATSYPRRVVELDGVGEEATVGGSRVLKEGMGVLVLERLEEDGRQLGEEEEEEEDEDDE